MSLKFPKDITDAMRDCMLAIFWLKRDIIAFFKNNGCTNTDLRIVNQRETELNRAQIVDIVFSSLHGRKDGGIGQFRAMLQALIEWTHFDPYYFKTIGKLNQNEAERRITHLRQIQEIRNAKIKAVPEVASTRALQAAERAKAHSLDELRERFLKLFRTEEFNHQQRGYEFEHLLQGLAMQAGLDVTESFRIKGEQIDAAIRDSLAALPPYRVRDMEKEKCEPHPAQHQQQPLPVNSPANSKKSFSLRFRRSEKLFFMQRGSRTQPIRKDRVRLCRVS